MDEPAEFFKKELDLKGKEKTVAVGILTIAKLRGFILNQPRDTDILGILQQARDTLPVSFPPSCSSFSDFLLYSCEKTEGL